MYTRALFLLFHQILFAAADSAMLEFWHIPKETTKGRDTIRLQSRTCNPAKLVVDGCWWKPLTFRLIRSRQIVFVKILHGRWRELILAIMIHDFLHLFGTEPPVHILFYHHPIGLSVEPFIIRLIVRLDGGCEIHADEPSTTRWITQHVGLIRSSDEWGITFELLDMFTVRTFDFYIRQLDDILQKTFLQFRTNRIKLVEINQ